MLSPTDIRSIQACIHDLNFVVENYGYLAARDPNERVQLGVGDTTRGIFDVDAGLCLNVFDPNKLPNHIKLCMFIAWDGFSGDPIYPVDGSLYSFVLFHISVWKALLSSYNFQAFAFWSS